MKKFSKVSGLYQYFLKKKGNTNFIFSTERVVQISCRARILWFTTTCFDLPDYSGKVYSINNF